jgi:hypothetical protein
MILGARHAVYQYVLAQAVMGLDQTGWPRLDGGGGKPRQMWCLTAPGVVVHRICHDKSAATFVDLVGAYEGTIVCDALATHAAGAREGPGITLAGCWAHVIRKFREAAVDHPDAQRAVEWIALTLRDAFSKTQRGSALVRDSAELNKKPASSLA